MQRATMIIGAAAASIISAAPAMAERTAEERQYTATYKTEGDVYCIRFFSDTLNDPRPNTAAPTCLTRARWVRHRVFIRHHHSPGDADAKQGLQRPLAAPTAP